MQLSASESIDQKDREMEMYKKRRMTAGLQFEKKKGLML
jgi:hypothetical protein